MRYEKDILRLRAEGKTYNEIINEIGCSRSTVSYHVAPDGKKNNKERWNRRHAASIIETNRIKEDSGCIDCNQKFPAYILDFDHLPEHEKVLNISRMCREKTYDEVMVEVAKCEVVCANCHRERTHRREVAKTISLAPLTE